MTILQFDTPFSFSPRIEQRTTMRRCRLEECRGACCLHGVWVDPLERDDILEHAKLILPQMAAGRGKPAGWFGDGREPEPAFPSGYVVPTTVLPNLAHYGGTECVFLRRDSRCALQAAAQAAGLDPWRWKPFHCIIHPLTFDGTGSITLAPDVELLAEEGSCFRPGTILKPIREWLSDELIFLQRMDRK